MSLIIYTSESGFGILIPKKHHRTNSSLRTVSFQIPKPFSDVYSNDGIFTKCQVSQHC